MFTTEQIKASHAKVKSGADFPAYVQELIAMGVMRYESFVIDGHVIYYGQNNFTLSSEAKYPSKQIAAQSDKVQFTRMLKMHQTGQTDYPAFCDDAARCGVEKWMVRTDAMTCTYFDKAGNEILMEEIPAK